MRAVLDLNVYVSALINPAGTPAEVVRLGLQRRYEIVVCPALLTELHEVLSRETFRRYFTLDEATEFVGAVAGASDEIADPATVEAVSRDPDDDYMVALAEARTEKELREAQIALRRAEAEAARAPLWRRRGAKDSVLLAIRDVDRAAERHAHAETAAAPHKTGLSEAEQGLRAAESVATTERVRQHLDELSREVSSRTATTSRELGVGPEL